MPESTCRDLVQILIEKGYLVQKHEGSNVYDFYERPEYAIISVRPPLSQRVRQFQKKEKLRKTFTVTVKAEILNFEYEHREHNTLTEPRPRFYIEK